MFGLLMTVPFALLFLMLVVMFAAGEMDANIFLVAGGITALCSVVGGMTLWFSWTSFRVNRKQAIESKKFIQHIRERKAAQQGSISVAVPTHGGDLELIEAMNHSESSRIELDLAHVEAEDDVVRSEQTTEIHQQKK